MEENRKKSTGSRVSETLLALVGNIKKAAADGRAKKASALLALLFAGNVAKGVAEEVVGKILFEPQFTDNGIGGICYRSILDTDDDFVEDRHMKIEFSNTTRILLNTLPRYLKENGGIVFEDEGLKPFQQFDEKRMLAIITPEGRKIELTQLFPLDVIKANFSYLYEKLVREGRAR